MQLCGEGFEPSTDITMYVLPRKYFSLKFLENIEEILHRGLYSISDKEQITIWILSQ